MPWRLVIPCCVVLSAITTLFSVVRFCASSPVSRTFPTKRPTPRCRNRSHPAKSHSSSLVRLLEAKQAQTCSFEQMRLGQMIIKHDLSAVAALYERRFSLESMKYL